MDVKSDSDMADGKFNFPVTAMGNETSIFRRKKEWTTICKI